MSRLFVALVVLATVVAGVKLASREADDRAVSARAQATAPDEARFQKVLLEGPLQQPMRIAVAPDRRVLFIERTGELKVWSPKTEKTTTAGRVRTATVGESGLIGLVLAPDFARTGHIYLNYARADYAKKFIARVSRFTLRRDNKLDKASETKIIDVQHPVGYEGGHDAGDLLMTPEGNLFIATGDNTSCCKSAGYPGLDERPGEKLGDAQRTASNTNSPIGKILRITPKPEGGYRIPAGNLFDEAKDPGDKTLPEIYAMGFRNPFQLGDYDPATGALWMADYGPDAVIADPERGPAGHVKLHLITKPGFFGWPYCTMDNQPYNHWNYVADRPGEFFDCAAPKNRSPNNTGLVDLPPAQPAPIFYTYTPNKQFPSLYGGGAHAGPMYRYDPTDDVKTRFPEYYNGRRFFYDWTQSWVQTTRFDDQGKPVDMQRFFRRGDFRQPMDMQFGPDGSLYVLDYGSSWAADNDDSGIYRIDYVEGNRDPAARVRVSLDSGPTPLRARFDATQTKDADGDRLTYAWDFDGNGSRDAAGARVTHRYRKPGVFNAKLTVTDPNGGRGVTDVSIIAGNARPEVRFKAPVDGRFADLKGRIPFKVAVKDRGAGTVDCTKVKVTYSLGHNEHAHPQGAIPVRRDCTGVYRPRPEAGHDPTAAYVYHVLEASYTDGGGDGKAPALTGSADLVLHPTEYAARTYQDGKGVGLYYGELFVPGSATGSASPASTWPASIGCGCRCGRTAPERRSPFARERLTAQS